MSGVPWQKRVIALGGMLQAVHLVSSIARTGMVSQDTMEDSLRSVFVVNPDSIAAVYGGVEGVRTGLKLVNEVMVKFNVRQHGDLLRYSLAVIKLERNLSRRTDMLRELGARIAAVDEQRMLRGAGGQNIDEQVVAALAEVYEDILSRIEPRIRVSGRRNYLQSATNINRIRALLLAAVRAAVLWHQVGGRRWQLLLARGHMNVALKYL